MSGNGAVNGRGRKRLSKSGARSKERAELGASSPLKPKALYRAKQLNWTSESNCVVGRSNLTCH